MRANVIPAAIRVRIDTLVLRCPAEDERLRAALATQLHAGGLPAPLGEAVSHRVLLEARAAANRARGGGARP